MSTSATKVVDSADAAVQDIKDGSKLYVNACTGNCTKVWGCRWIFGANGDIHMTGACISGDSRVLSRMACWIAVYVSCARARVGFVAESWHVSASFVDVCVSTLSLLLHCGMIAMMAGSWEGLVCAVSPRI